MEILDFSVAPGAVRELHCQGSYVYFYGGSAGGADATIGVKMDARGERVLLMPGQAFRMEPGQKAQRWIISNHAGQAKITGRLVIGSGQIDDNRVTGSVEVVDGGMARTMADEAYLASSSIIASVGNESLFMLNNPGASGKNVIINSIVIGSTTGTTVFVGRSTAEPLGTMANPANKKMGSASLSIAKKYDSNPAALPVITQMAGFAVSSGISFSIPVNDPLVLLPGNSLTIHPSGVNETLTVYVEFFERKIE